MQKILGLLKYLNTTALTPEAVVEIASLSGFEIAGGLARAAVILNEYKTRGLTALLAHAGDFKPIRPKVVGYQIPLTCPHCHELAITGIAASEIERYAVIADETEMKDNG